MLTQFDTTVANLRNHISLPHTCDIPPCRSNLDSTLTYETHDHGPPLCLNQESTPSHFTKYKTNTKLVSRKFMLEKMVLYRPEKSCTFPSIFSVEHFVLYLKVCLLGMWPTRLPHQAQNPGGRAGLRRTLENSITLFYYPR